MVSLSDLPAVNALLNGSSFILVMFGSFFIRRRNIRAHKACMIAAVVISTLFLISYLVYHYNVGSVRFTKVGWIRSVYFTILLSHTLLAMAVLPLVLLTVLNALRKNFSRHMKIARWTVPIWGYVSLTGVVVYLMLYQF